jgi:hypothetical protein
MAGRNGKISWEMASGFPVWCFFFGKRRRKEEMKRYLLLAIVLLLAPLAGCGGETAKRPEPITLEVESEGFVSRLEISPGIVGPNTFTATIADKSQKAVTTGEAALHFSMAGMEHGKSELPLTGNGEGQWQGEGPHLMMPGEWQLQLVWTDEAGQSHAFDYTLKVSE